MLRFFTIVVLLSGIPSLLSAQDKLIKKNGDTLEVKIRAVGLKQIKYSITEDEQAASLEVRKRKFAKIDFSNGKTLALSNADDKYFPLTSKKNILTLVPGQIFDTSIGLGISYERILRNQRVGIIVPFVMSRANTYYYSDSFNYVFYLSPGLKFYPFGHRKITYALGPNLFAGLGRYFSRDFDYQSGYYAEGYYSQTTRIGFVGNNYLTLNVFPNFKIGMNGGFGVRYMDRKTAYNSYKSLMEPTVEYSFNLSYHF
jgi:hypothetical protein